MATGERLSQVGDAKSSFDTLKPVLDEVAAGVSDLRSTSPEDGPSSDCGRLRRSCRATRSVLFTAGR